MQIKTAGNIQCARSHSLLEQSIAISVVFTFGSIIGHFHGQFSIPENSNSFFSAEHQPKSLETAPWAENVKRNNKGNEMNRKTEAKKGLNSAADDGTAQSINWRAIDIFSGDTRRHLKAALAESNNTHAKWFSSHQQDQLVLGLLRNKQRGFFVDLAAGDAINQSNTLGLEINAQWNGICIEPNPMFWYGLSYYRTCQVVAAVVGRNRMEEVDFRYSNYQTDYFGGTVATKKHDHRGRSLFRPRKPQFSVPLSEILQINQSPNTIDYLNLDLEGAEEAVLQHFLASPNITFSIITVKTINENLQKLFAAAGYRLLKNFTQSGGSIFAQESSIARMDLAVLVEARH